jgi:hypothetical protein
MRKKLPFCRTSVALEAINHHAWTIWSSEGKVSGDFGPGSASIARAARRYASPPHFCKINVNDTSKVLGRSTILTFLN